MYKNIKKCSVDEINQLIEYLKKYNRIFKLRPPEPNEEIGRFNVFLYQKISKVTLIYKDLINNGIVRQYVAKLDVEFDGVDINGVDAYKILQKYYKAPSVNTKEDAPFSIGIRPYRNIKFIGKRTSNCFGYDLNSAYPYGMLQKLPNTEKPLKPGIVGNNEYSFTNTGLRAKTGEYSIYRFELMDSPYIKFVKRWYNKKKLADNKADKNKAKFVLNAAIGALQNHNCYLRAAIINNFHEVINSVFLKYKNNILSMNVDSIVSNIRIPELDANLGDEIGQWKLEHIGDYAIHQNGFSTQWNRDKPAFGAGKSKNWFGKDYDILTDDIPDANNIYELDTDEIIIRRKQ